MAGKGWVTVSTAQGVLKGKRDKTISGKPYCAFLAIPYAKPPVGELRFKPPQPAEKWTGIRDATKAAKVAPQFNPVTKQVIGDEDCLYLNVYTTRAPTGIASDLLPVMVWIHGGGFVSGSGNGDMYNPDYLLEHDVVIVTTNYRLAAFGFASLGEAYLSGNMGLKDLVLALHWVKEHITSYGGDPKNVTIFGESAGGTCCHALVLSPLAKGLFSRAIIQSGTAIGGETNSTRMAERTFALAESLGMASKKPEEVAAFLRDLPAQKIVENFMEARTKEDKQRNMTFPYVPTVEPEDAEGGAFFSRHPLDILKSGNYNRVPIIMGVTSMEGVLFLIDMAGGTKDWRSLNTSFQNLLPSDLPISKGERMSAARDVKSFYFGNEPLEEETINQYIDMRGDIFFIYPAVKAATIHASKQTAPVYFYSFSVDAGLNFFKKLFKFDKIEGASHADDLGYLFRVSVPGLPVPESAPSPDSIEGKTIARMTKMWTNFAKTGNPVPHPHGLLETAWPQFSAKDASYVDIGNEKISVHKQPFKERCDFWDRLYSSRK